MKKSLPLLWLTFLFCGCGGEVDDDAAAKSRQPAKPVDLDDPQAREVVFYDAVVFDEMKALRKDGIDLLHEAQGKEPYSGWVREMYLGGELKNLIQYKDGRQHGQSVWWLENGRKSAQRHFKDGQPNGLWISWDENGTKVEERHFMAGQLDGPWILWNKNGSKTEERHFKDGQPDGLWTAWRENGNKANERHFKAGQQDGPAFIWYENGQQATEGRFAAGKLFSATAWKPNGEKCPVSEIVEGNGVMVWYNIDGTENFRITYKDGSPAGN